MNGYSLIYFVLYVFAQPSWAAFFFIKLSFRKGKKRSCKPQNLMVETSKFENNFFLTMQEWASTSWLSKTFNVFEILYILVRWFNFHILHVMNLSIIVNYICIRKHLCRVFNYVSKWEECVFYILKLLKSIFIIIGKIKILYLDRGSIAFSLNKYLNLVFLWFHMIFISYKIKFYSKNLFRFMSNFFTNWQCLNYIYLSSLKDFWHQLNYSIRIR